jgi:hypothetical protein
MRTSLLLGTMLALACSEAPRGTDPLAERCAAVVAFYLGVEAPVAVTAADSEPTEGRVRIEYRTQRANLPVDGTAVCRFRSLEDGGLQLSAAFVDDNRLRPDEVEAFGALQ